MYINLELDMYLSGGISDDAAKWCRLVIMLVRDLAPIVEPIGCRHG